MIAAMIEVAAVAGPRFELAVVATAAGWVLFGIQPDLFTSSDGTPLYAPNQGLDRDKDGVACEKA